MERDRATNLAQDRLAVANRSAAPSGRAADLIYLVVARLVRQSILAGDFGRDGKLPSIRQAALRYSVSKNTVIAAYIHLEQQGLILSRDRSGFYLAPNASEASEPQIIEHPLSLVEQRGLDILSELEELRRNSGHDLLSPILDTRLLPHAMIARAARKIIAEDMGSCLTADFGPGYRPLRLGLAAYYRHRDVIADERDFLTTLGCTHALVAAIEASTQPGDAVAIRTPTFYPLLRMLHSLNRKVVEIPGTADRSRDLDRLDNAIAKFNVRACLVSVSLPDPHGGTLSDEDKRRLIDLAARFDMAIIEDDVFGHLSAGNRAACPLKAFDDDGRVLHCSSFSKTLGSGLRVGWCLPGRYMRQMQNVRSIVAPAMPVLEQAIIARFLESASFARHVRDLKHTVRKNAQTLQRAMGKGLLAGARLTSEGDSMLAWVQLPPGTSGWSIYKAALERNVAVAPGLVYSLGDHFDGHIRISLCVDVAHFGRAIALIESK
jgi:DNA-binding transcriptional MocR family regulator